MSTPPEEHLPIPDLRTVGDREPGTISPDFRDLLNDVQRKQSWYREYAIENQEDPFEYLGKFNINNDVNEVANSIRSVLGITNDVRKIEN